jgi:multidrug resistance efflux pump
LVSDLSLLQAEPTVHRQKKSSLALKIALPLIGLGAVGLFGWLRWSQAHRALPAESARIVAEIEAVDAPLAGTVQQLLVKPGQRVKAGDLVALVANPDLVKRYQEAETHLENAKKLDTTTQAAIVPPHLDGNLISSGPPVDFSMLKPLPTAGPVSTRNPAVSNSSSQTEKVAALQSQVANAEKIVAQCTDTVQAVQADVDAAQSSAQSQGSPMEDLKSAVEMAKSKRDKFQGLYNEGIISRSEFQQKQAELDTAQANLDQAAQGAASAQSKVKAKQDDLDQAKSALASAQQNLDQQQRLLAKALTTEKLAATSSPLPKSPQPLFVRPEIRPPSLRGKLRQPRFSMIAPKVAPLSVIFSPDKHLHAENEVTVASRNLQTIADELKGCRIVAPTDGTVSAIDVREGQAIELKSPILEIMRPASERVEATFSHAEALRIRYGQACLVSFDFLPHRKFAGTVARFLDAGSKSSPATLEIALSDQTVLLAGIPLRTGAHVEVLPR